jgi:TonB-linked SusC/RagA family outer membrane protein
MKLNFYSKNPLLHLSLRKAGWGKVLNKQNLLVMKLIFLLLTVTCLQLSAESYAQQITVHKKNITLEEVFEQIHDQTGYQIVSTKDVLKDARKVSLNVKDASLQQVLEMVLKGQSLTYTFHDKAIIVKRKESRQAKQTRAIPPVQVTGKITDSLGNPLVGVTIKAKAGGTGTVTDANGDYTVTVPDDAVLVVSYVGYQSEEIKVNGREEIDIVLKSSVSELNQLVVVGYGTQKKKDLTGAISVINASQLKNKFFTNTTEALRGAKGVYISQPGAQPGRGKAIIRIRGQGTLNNNDPLVLVDGIEYELSKIDPNNIKSISVLKDAAAAAIYGSRAANGVVLVTTKNGEGSEGFHISYDNYFGVSKAINLPDYVKDPIRFFELRNQAQRNAGSATVTYSDELIDDYKNGMKTDPLAYPTTDWYKIALKSAFVQKHNLRIYGGSSNYNYSLALGYNDQKGILRGTNSKKYSIDLNTSVNVTERFTVKAIIDGQIKVYHEPVAGANYLMDQVNREASVPYDPVLTKDGKFASPFIRTPGHYSYRNPLAIINEGLNRHNEQSYRFSLQGQYRFPLDITYNVLVGYTKQDYLNQIFEPAIFQYNVKTGEMAERSRISGTPITHAENSDTYNDQVNFHQTLRWQGNLKNGHNIFVLLGNSVQLFDDNNFFAHREGYLGNDLTTLNAGSTNPDVGGTYSKRRLVSLFGRFRYNYREKYLFEANYRYDGSSRFAKGHRWGLFPSFSAGWQIGNEKFMGDIKWIDALKLRVSWGKLGNNRIASYRYINLVDLGHDYSFGDNIASGGAITEYSDPNITWETTTTSNIGVDATLFKNRLDFSFEVYNKKTANILHVVPLPAQVGDLNGPIENIGTVSNKGIEIDLSYHNAVGAFKYEIGGNLSTVKNEVLALDGQTIYNFGWRSGGGTVIEEGYPINSYYLLHSTGVFQNKQEIAAHAFQSNDTKPGYLEFEDANGDGKINQDDRVISDKSRIPKYTYTFNLSLNYKRISLSAWLTGVGKVYTYSNYYGIVPFWYGSGVTEYWVKNSWSPEHTDAKLPILTTYEGAANTNFRNSDFLLYDVSYLRLKNVQISYDFPNKLMDRLHLTSAEIFVSADNLLTITPMPYYDPEKNLSDHTFSGYPASQTFTVGIRVDL